MFKFFVKPNLFITNKNIKQILYKANELIVNSDTNINFTIIKDGSKKV